MNTQTLTQRRAIHAYNEAHRGAIYHAERTPAAPHQPEPFDWIDSAVFLSFGVVVAALIFVASWAGWLA